MRLRMLHDSGSCAPSPSRPAAPRPGSGPAAAWRRPARSHGYLRHAIHPAVGTSRNAGTIINRMVNARPFKTLLNLLIAHEFCCIWERSGILMPRCRWSVASWLSSTPSSITSAASCDTKPRHQSPHHTQPTRIVGGFGSATAVVPLTSAHKTCEDQCQLLISYSCIVPLTSASPLFICRSLCLARAIAPW